MQAARCGLDMQQSLHAVGMHHVHIILPIVPAGGVF